MQKPNRLEIHPTKRKRKLSEKQLKALRDNQHIGFKLRSLMCVVAMSGNNMSKERAQIIRELVDAEMHDMGYESYTEQRKRIREYFAAKKSATHTPNSFFKLQRLSNLPELREKYLGGSNEC